MTGRLSRPCRCRLGRKTTFSRTRRMPGRREASAPSDRRIVGEAFLTSAANPKLAVFFVALFPTFIPDGEAVLPRALTMAALVIVFDFVWYVTLGALVSRAGRAVVGSRLGRRLEVASGAVFVALAGRLALERR